MLHVILTILKIIGILLLVILGILLAVILLVLFVPVRYRLHGRRENETLEADGRVSWLLRLMRIDFSWKDRQGLVEVKFLWFVFRSYSFPKKETEPAVEGGSAEECSGDGSSEKIRVGEELTGDRIQPEENPVEGKTGAEETSAGEKTLAEESSAGGKTGAEEKPAEDRNQEKAKQDKERRSKDSHHKDAAQESLSQKILRIAGQIREMARNLLLSIPQIPAEVLDRIDRVLDRTSEKFNKIIRKSEPYLDALTERVVRKIIRLVRTAVRGYAPRKIEGYLRFGTGAPDVTGKLTGLIFVLMPESGNGYEVIPDFYESVLETETTVSGRIFLYHLVWMGIRFLADKELRTALFRILGMNQKKHRHNKQKKRKNRKQPGESRG